MEKIKSVYKVILENQVEANHFYKLLKSNVYITKQNYLTILLLQQILIKMESYNFIVMNVKLDIMIWQIL